jgi:hypothetical protein
VPGSFDVGVRRRASAIAAPRFQRTCCLHDAILVAVALGRRAGDQSHMGLVIRGLLGAVLGSLATTPYCRRSATLSAGASKWNAGRLGRLMLSPGSGHHTPWGFYLMHSTAVALASSNPTAVAPDD